MENFNKNSLKAAVAKYGPLHADGKAEADVKAVLLADDKGYSAEQVDEIYAAIVSEQSVGLFGGSNEPESGKDLTSETPEWVQAILDSNEAVLQSNQLVIDSLGAFKENSAEFVAQLVEEFAPKKDVEPTIANNTGKIDFNPEFNYHVLAGVSFRDPKDFDKKYNEADEVTHLGEAVITKLLSQGLVGGLPREQED